MENHLISIIVPVYNVKEYLDECLSSILSQTYKNIEVVIVDDGSTDGSAQVCQRYAEMDNRIKLLSQKNQGLTKARKNGAGLITGEYLSFVDADDYIESDLYYRLMEQANGHDLITYKWFREEENKVRCAGDKLAVGEYKTSEDMDFLFRHLVNVSTPGGEINLKSGFAPFVWNKLFKSGIAKSVFEEINEQIDLFEDCDFTYRYLLKCKSVFITDIYGYHYRIRNGSICHTVDREGKFLNNVWRLYKSLYPVFAKHEKSGILLAQLEIKVLALLEKAPCRMGFSQNTILGNMVFPFLNILKDKKIVLYGAGMIGSSYWYQIAKWNACDIVLWIDKNWEDLQKEGMPVQDPNKILCIEFDYIVLAESNRTVVQLITDSLLSKGIDEHSILWAPPLQL